MISHEKIIRNKAGALKSTVKSNRIISTAINGKLNWIWQYTQKPVYVEDKKTYHRVHLLRKKWLKNRFWTLLYISSNDNSSITYDRTKINLSPCGQKMRLKKEFFGYFWSHLIDWIQGSLQTFCLCILASHYNFLHTWKGCGYSSLNGLILGQSHQGTKIYFAPFGCDFELFLTNFI